MVESWPNLEQFALPETVARRASGCGSCGAARANGESSQCGNGLEKIYPTTAVRFGFMRYIGEFSHAPDMKFTCGAKVIIQTKRGIEMGEQVSLTCSGCDKSVTRDKMKEWVDTCGEDSFLFEAGRILREATAADLAEYARIQHDCREKRDFARRLAVEDHRLPIRVVDCETLFGGERIIFFFTANERVDFRAMVKDLAREYRTRIEMRQVGARDEARLLADFETCGREVCCKVFLKTLRPISMRMAKLQKATLDPSQVSGRCGRLKCCLRYEHVSYEELDRSLPRNGVRIRTNHGEGVIVNRQVLTQLVQIRTDDDQLVTVVVEDITAVGVPRPEAPPEGSAPSRERGGRRPSRTPDRPRPRRAPEPRSDEVPAPADDSGGADISDSAGAPDSADAPESADAASADGALGEDSSPEGADRPTSGDGSPGQQQRKRRKGRRRPRRRPRSGGEGSTGSGGGDQPS